MGYCYMFIQLLHKFGKSDVHLTKLTVWYWMLVSMKLFSSLDIRG